MIPRHATDVISLVAGVIFTGFTAVWILTVSGTIDENQAWIGGPITMITAGTLGLAAALWPKQEAELPAPAVARPAASAPSESAATVAPGHTDQEQWVDSEADPWEATDGEPAETSDTNEPAGDAPQEESPPAGEGQDGSDRTDRTDRT